MGAIRLYQRNRVLQNLMEKTFYAQFSDDAGNYSEVVSTSIILDTTPPQIENFVIDDGEE
jgi:hypothetical protein